MTVVVDIFGEIVAKVSEKLLPVFQELDPNITAVHYLYGHPREIIETLAQRDASDTYVFRKYPLIGLFQDFPEKQMPNDIVEVTLNVVLCKSTMEHYKAAERYERNFKPFLYPMYEELVKQVQKHPKVEGYSQTHIKIDRLFWGKQAANGSGNVANKFNDRLDAIEIINFNLKLNQIRC